MLVGSFRLIGRTRTTSTLRQQNGKRLQILSGFGSDLRDRYQWVVSMRKVLFAYVRLRVTDLWVQHSL